MIVVRLLVAEGKKIVIEDTIAIMAMEMFCRFKMHLITPVVDVISSIPKIISAAHRLIPRGPILFINLRGHEMEPGLVRALLP
jgi:hypothetical protein